MTEVNSPEQGILAATLDERVGLMAIDLMWGMHNIGQVMLTHMMNAIEVAYDHGISVLDVEKACELRIKAAAGAGHGDF